VEYGNTAQCDFPGCDKKFDLRKWEKPPPGWGVVSIQRWGKGGAKSDSRLVCPEHTMDFAPRIGVLPQRTQWKRVLIESPFASSDPSEVETNIRYVRAIMGACLRNGEAPFASHALYTLPGVLDDKNPAERKMGIEAGLEWGEAADKTIVYTDRGISDRMRIGMRRADQQKRPFEKRRLKGWSG